MRNSKHALVLGLGDCMNYEIFFKRYKVVKVPQEAIAIYTLKDPTNKRIIVFCPIGRATLFVNSPLKQTITHIL